MSLSLWSLISKQICLGSKSADASVHRSFEEEDIEGGWVNYLTSSSPLHTFQLCIIKQLKKLISSSPSCS